MTLKLHNSIPKLWSKFKGTYTSDVGMAQNGQKQGCALKNDSLLGKGNLFCGSLNELTFGPKYPNFWVKKTHFCP